MTIRHYLDFDDLSQTETESLIARAIDTKARVQAGDRAPTLASRLLTMIFERPSTRTRISFAAAMTQAGGNASTLAINDLQLSRGESIADTARAISTMCDALMIRARDHQTLEEFSAYASCPLINGLSNKSHPCQVLADVMTFMELRGDLHNRKIAWLGDMNNVLFSWAQAAEMFNATLTVACPPAYQKELPAKIIIADDARQAAKNADLVMTDVWTSMGDETEQESRRAAFANYSVDANLMRHASPQAIFMHCLPAHRGEEVAAEVIDGAQSVVWQQAQNRLHAQKALLEMLICPHYYS